MLLVNMKFGRAASDEFASTVVTDANIVPPCNRDRLLETRNEQYRLDMQIRNRGHDPFVHARGGRLPLNGTSRIANVVPDHVVGVSLERREHIMRVLRLENAAR